MSKWIQFATPVEETKVETTESHDEYMHRRGKSMAGMIGMMQARLEMIDIDLESAIIYADNVKQAKKYMTEMRQGILNTLIEYMNRWSEMQDYKEEDYMYGRHKEKIEQFTSKLNNLK